MTSTDLRAARQAKQDEFYTSLGDIELEMAHYSRHFKDKIVYCNCDDPRESNFFRYFATNFKKLGLRKLITTCYRGAGINRKRHQKAAYFEYAGGESWNGDLNPSDIGVEPLKGDGDFRSDESIRLLKQADIIVTNPPFSLFREYVSQLIDNNKEYLILGNMNALTYKAIFPLFQDNRMWYGPSIRSGDREFRVPNDYPLTAAGTRVDSAGNKFVRVKGVRWFTNLDYSERHKVLDLQMSYNPSFYPKYVNYDAIEVSKTANIPADYSGPMGVPITFLDRYNPDQFEIRGSSKTLGKPMSKIAEKGTYQQGGPRFYLENDDGTYRRMYDRIVIKKRGTA